MQSKLLLSVPFIQHAFTVKDTELNGMRNSLVMPDQIHGNDVVVIDDYARHIQADAFITGKRNLPIGIVTADCVPLLLIDTKHHIISALHAGWKGTLQKIVQNALDAMEQEGASRKSIIAVIGPAIKSCCYSVSQERTQLFTEEFGSNSIIYYGNKAFIDLQKINYEQLRTGGILPNHVEIIDLCTCCNPDKFYSYRRGDRDKRMVSYIQMV